MPFRDTVRYHFRNNRFQYIFLTVLFVLGMISGTYVVMEYEVDEVKEVTIFMEDFLRIFSMETIDFEAIFKTSVLNMAKELLIVWLLGFTVIGILGIVLLVFRRGFLIGFVSAFFIKVYTIKGVGISLCMFFSQAFFYLPFLMILGVFAFELSVLLFRMITGKMKYKTDIRKFILLDTGVMIFSILAGCIYAWCETYITPYFLKMLI